MLLKWYLPNVQSMKDFRIKFLQFSMAQGNYAPFIHTHTQNIHQLDTCLVHMRRLDHTAVSLNC